MKETKHKLEIVEDEKKAVELRFLEFRKSKEDEIIWIRKEYEQKLREIKQSDLDEKPTQQYSAFEQSLKQQHEENNRLR